MRLKWLENIHGSGSVGKTNMFLFQFWELKGALAVYFEEVIFIGPKRYGSIFLLTFASTK